MRKLPSLGSRGRRWSAARRFRGWLATWAQDRRRGRANVAQVPVSLFAANDPDRLYWTGGIDDPASGWLLEYFDPGDGMFVQLALLPYSPRSFNRAPFDLRHRIRQVNNPVDEVPIGDWSNEVIW